VGCAPWPGVEKRLPVVIPAKAGIHPLHPLRQFLVQIVPLGIILFDEIDLLLPIPFLELLFTIDRLVYVLMGLKIDQVVNLVLLGKSGN